MNHKFKVGDRVRVVGLREASELNGTVTTVLAVNPKHCSVTGRPWLHMSVPAYEIDIPDRENGGNCGVAERNLEPYYDGNEKVSWSSCVWQPTSIRA